MPLEPPVLLVSDPPASRVSCVGTALRFEPSGERHGRFGSRWWGGAACVEMWAAWWDEGSVSRESIGGAVVRAAASASRCGRGRRAEIPAAKAEV